MEKKPNATIAKLPKKYRDAVKYVSDERNNSDGWFVYLNKPYFNKDLETSFISEETLTDCIVILKTIVDNHK